MPRTDVRNDSPIAPGIRDRAPRHAPACFRRSLLLRSLPLLASAILLLALDVPAMDGRSGAGAAARMWTIALSGGIADVGIRDEFVTPVVYRAPLLSLRLSLERRMRSGHQRLECRYAGGALESDILPRDVREHLAGVSWSRFWPVHAWPLPGAGMVALRAGGGVSTTFSDTDFRGPEGFSLVEVIDESWYWAHAVDFGLALAWTPDAGRSSVSVEAVSPIVRLVSRPDYAHSLARRNHDASGNFLRSALGGRLTPPWRDPSLTVGATGVRQIGDRLAIQAGWQLGWWSAESPQPLRLFSNDFLAGARWSF